MNKQFMTAVAPNSIEEGPIPFSLFTPDQQGRFALFCGAGFPITEKHLNLLEAGETRLFIGSDDYEAFLDYTFKRIDRITANPRIRISDKAEIAYGIAKRTVKRFLDDLQNKSAMEELKRVAEAYVELILAWPDAARNLLALSSHDPYYFAHSINACTFCILLGLKMGTSDSNELSLLGLGGLLQDSGKVLVDHAIIYKPAGLTPEELEEVRKHVALSVDIVTEHGLPDTVIEMCRSHHERLDGSGYPDGLKGDSMGLPARIAALADVYDALTSDRIYARGLPHLEALSIVAAEIQKFDHKVFGALLDVVLRNTQLIEGFCNKHISGDIRAEVLEASRDSTEADDGSQKVEAQ